ncbi:MAG: ferrous iron transport protein A [Erysipelothrix sp.]|uniref:FeoA family protein n=1 Tax=Desulfitibacter alkalitolerans TaxID=264641 RepID=UPI000486357B|nr:FeoA family protein [Desulfitibacter alkalitolerans]MBS3987026.1 ferrous iron transport protein A [Erysipelothrix sp.]
MKKLDEAKPGEELTIEKIMLKDKTKYRLMSMGVTPGTSVKVEKIAPLGDPIEIKVRGYLLSLRKKEASQILVMERERIIT